MWTWEKSRRSWGMLRPFGRVHVRWLVRGTLATVGLVLLRLALPWPLKGVVEIFLPKHGPQGAGHLAWLPSFGDPILWLVGGYVLLVLLVGLAEMVQRICMAKFATHSVHDMRAAAVRSSAGPAGAARRSAPGELIARIVGDAARVKESMKGILIHTSQNGLFYAGVGAVFCFISPRLSLFFLLGGLIAVGVGSLAANRVASVFKKQRSKEAAYAEALHEGLESDNVDLDSINQSSAVKDVRVTKLMTLSSLVIHGALAATTGLAVWVGAVQVRAGTLSTGNLVLFIAYALTAHHRAVQVGRQIARSGKLMACVDRIGSLIGEGGPVPTATVKPLEKELRLEGVRLDSERAEDDGPARVAALDLSLRSGAKVAVLGGTGSGKSSLLRILAGLESPDAGRIAWDGEEIIPASGALVARSGFLSQDPVLARRRVWRILGLENPEAPADDALRALKRCGAWKIILRFPKGLKEKVSSSTLSQNETRILRLGAILLGGAPLWILDSPFEGLGRRRARRSLDEILSRAGNRTLVVAIGQPFELDRFDRVIVIDGGRIRFDGTPREWRERKLIKK